METNNSFEFPHDDPDRRPDPRPSLPFLLWLVLIGLGGGGICAGFMAATWLVTYDKPRQIEVATRPQSKEGMELPRPPPPEPIRDQGPVGPGIMVLVGMRLVEVEALLGTKTSFSEFGGTEVDSETAAKVVSPSFRWDEERRRQAIGSWKSDEGILFVHFDFLDDWRVTGFTFVTASSLRGQT